MRSDEERADFARVLAQVPNHARRVPVPRRVIRLLALGGTRVLLATMFGHLLRCAYYRDRKCRPTGTCKASWIATVFGVDVRNVKAARKLFVDYGLLRFERVGQQFLNRHGPLVTINLDWAPPTSAWRRSPPPVTLRRDVSPPPIGEHELLRKLRNQNPVATRAAGVRSPVPVAARPSLRHVVPQDLADPVRLVCLYEQACLAGYVGASESERLNFFAMAEHARAVANRNAPGLFAANIRNRRWQVISLADEDAARRVLSRLPAAACRAPCRLESIVGRGRATSPPGVSHAPSGRESPPVPVRQVVPRVIQELPLRPQARLNAPMRWKSTPAPSADCVRRHDGPLRLRLGTLSAVARQERAKRESDGR